jgi:hypothetical protein
MFRSSSSLSIWSAGVLALVSSIAAPTVAHAAVTISSAATQNMSCSSGVCTPTVANAVLNIGDLTTMLASGNVTVNTGTGSLAQQVEDIAVSAGFNWASAHSLTLDAYRSVTFNQPVAVNGSGAVSLVTDDGGSAGTLSFISGGSLSFLSTSNSLSINGKPYTLANSIATLAADIAGKPSGRYALSASYDASHDHTYKSSPIPTKFTGAFNGLGNTISNLTVHGGAKSKKDATVGLFSYVKPSGSISSLRVTGANIAEAYTASKVQPSASVVVAVNYGTVFNSFASGQVSGLALTEKIIGAGGLVGVNGGTIAASAASVNVTLSGDSSTVFPLAGGLVGANGGMTETSYSSGTVSVVGGAQSAYLGGLAGESIGPVMNCYAEGAAVTSSLSNVGGLVGLASSTVSSAYSTGTASGGSGSNIGGLLGVDDHQANGGTIANDYWDTTTSGITNLSDGAGNVANDPGITGETSAQLQSGLPAGFDPTIWAENPSINNGLPYLIANPPQ